MGLALTAKQFLTSRDLALCHRQRYTFVVLYTCKSVGEISLVQSGDSLTISFTGVENRTQVAALKRPVHYAFTHSTHYYCSTRICLAYGNTQYFVLASIIRPLFEPANTGPLIGVVFVLSLNLVSTLGLIQISLKIKVKSLSVLTRLSKVG